MRAFKLDAIIDRNIKRESLRAKVDEIVKVSTIPSVLGRIMDVMDDSHSSVADLEKIIEHDQAIAARIVGVSNSVYYGFPRRIGSISQAILVLGFEMVKGLAVSTAVFKDLSGKNRENSVKLWIHSFETAIAASLLAERTGLVGRESAFLAGLLHDIGRPILYQIFGKDYFDAGLPGKCNLLKNEEDVFGAAHPEVGAQFAEKCKLPEDCVTAIRYHHNPQDYVQEAGAGGPLKNLLPVVYLADLTVSEGNDCLDKYTIISPAHADILKAANIDGSRLEEIKKMVESMEGQIREFYC